MYKFPPDPRDQPHSNIETSLKNSTTNYLKCTRGGDFNHSEPLITLATRITQPSIKSTIDLIFCEQCSSRGSKWSLFFYSLLDILHN